MRFRYSFTIITFIALYIGLGACAIKAHAQDSTKFHQINLSLVPHNISKPTISLTNSAIKENSPAGTVVGTFHVINSNSGDSLSSAYHFVLTDDANKTFALNDSSLVVRNVNNLNYEKNRYLSVSVQVVGETGNTIKKTFRIRIINVNEPPDSISLSDTTIAENSPPGTVIGNISGSDPDSGDVLTYRLIKNADGKIAIQSNRLVVADSASIDYEKTHFLHIVLRATDKDGLFLDKFFTIRVLNRNDPPTKITLSNYSVFENSPNGTLVGTLSTVDEDSADSHSYQLLNSAGGRFAIRGKNLVVADSSHLNYEADSTHTITIKSTDSGNLSVTKQILIHVINVNEPPIIKGFRNLITNEDVPSDTLHFYISDPETPASELQISTYSSNPDLIDENGIHLGGEGHNRWMVLVSRHDSSGTASITYSVSDGVNHSFGTLQLTVNPVNDPPVLAVNKGIKLDEGSSRVINDDDLRVTDVDNTPNELTFTILKSPSHGAIYRDTTQLHGNSTFTEANIRQGIISYKHDGSETTKDNMLFRIDDGAGGIIDSIPFHVIVIPVNDPPVISRIPSIRTSEDTPTPPIPFRISDAETPAADLELSYTSSNSSLLPDSNIIIRGVEKNRTITLKPAPNQNGTSLITMIVSDGQAHDIARFFFIVNPVNDPPTVSTIHKQEVKEDQTKKIKFHISDIDTPIGKLKVWAKSSNEVLLSNKSISFTGNGNDREMIISPGNDLSGTTKITLFVSDQDSTITTNFPLTIEPTNDPPDEFSLYNSSANATTDSLNISFNWEKSYDKDNNPVTYLLKISGNNLDTTISNIHSTHFVFNGKNKLQANVMYQWSVLATDGRDTTACMMSKDFVSPAMPAAPQQFDLSPNFPNPFNPLTTIHYQLPTPSKVTLSIYDLLGRKVTDLVNTDQLAGEYKVDWNASGMASGVYIYQIIAISNTGNKRFIETRKMLLLK